MNVNTAESLDGPEVTGSAPKTFNGDLDAPPAALAPLYSKDHWLVWRWEEHKGKFTKPPFQARFPDVHARNNDATTWATLDDAVKAVKQGKAHGIGFVLTGTNIAAIDLDHCRDPVTGQIDGWAQDIINRMPGAYVEVTVSGKGLRVIGTTAGQETHTKFKMNGRDGAQVEIYRKAVRYITVSGQQIGECTEVPNIDPLIDELLAEYAGTKPAANGHDKPEIAKRGINEIIKNGAPEGQRSEAFQAVVSRLAKAGLSIDAIEERLTEYPDGIAKKYEGRLRPEIERSFRKWEASSGSAALNNDPDQEEVARAWA
jgi:hypothetical protein